MESTLPSDELLARYDVSGPRYTSYPTAPNWDPSFGPEDFAQRLKAAASVPAPLSLYVHLPYCQSLCWYCGCNVVIARTPSGIDDYLAVLQRELELVAHALGPRRTVSQLHYGGGTPTLLNHAQLVRLWSAIIDRFLPLADAEISIEIHPGVTSLDQLRLLRRLGFNRASIGLQDLDPEVQRATHRLQTPEQTRAVLDEARSLGYSGINLDLIYGLPKQTADSWQRTLDQVLAMRPDRVAVYSFAYVPEVLKHQRRLPAEAIPARDSKLALFREAWRRFTSAGYQPIGMDHFALPGDALVRAQSSGRLIRNFQGYTVRRAPDLVGLGASAISDVGGAYAQNLRNLKAYADRIGAGRLATDRGWVMSDDDVRRRAIISDLMCHFHAELGAGGFADELRRLEPLERDGLVKREGGTLSITALGRPFVRNVAMAFDRYLAEGPRRFSRTI